MMMSTDSNADIFCAMLMPCVFMHFSVYAQTNMHE